MYIIPGITLYDYVIIIFILWKLSLLNNYFHLESIFNNHIIFEIFTITQSIYLLLIFRRKIMFNLLNPLKE